MFSTNLHNIDIIKIIRNNTRTSNGFLKKMRNTCFAIYKVLGNVEIDEYGHGILSILSKSHII